jgi:hypothetical protein
LICRLGRAGAPMTGLVKVLLVVDDEPRNVELIRMEV